MTTVMNHWLTQTNNGDCIAPECTTLVVLGLKLCASHRGRYHRLQEQTNDRQDHARE